MSVTDFGSIFSLFNTPWGLNVGVVVGSIIDHSVQVFFVTRIYRVTGLLSVSIALGIIVVFLQGVSFSLAAEAIRSDSIIVVGERWNWLLTVLFFGDAGLDITTSLVLCYFLKKKGRTAFKSTTVLLDRLVVYTLQTGLTTSFVALGAAISFKAAPHYFIWTGFFMAMPGSFMSALLANINNRKNLVPSSSAGTGSANQSLGGIQISRNIVLSRDDIDPTNLAKSDTDVADNSMELTKLSAQQGVYGTSTV
ncbi:hypothetical protein B0H10DRAFT_387406 [Mycena sp. CBHHK59/15]|nr:hypothetical protein B0H10DRAFT_387406 [Mycena sp. CBHHK59/15]